MAIALVTILPIYLIYSPVNRSDTNPAEIIIGSGDGLQIIADKLTVADLIRSKFLFVGYVKLRGQEDELKAGRYIFSKSLNIPILVSLIVGGRSEPDDLIVTIPEGFNIWGIDKRLVELGLITMGQVSNQYLYKEGYMFPDTYRFDKKTSAENIVNRMEENYFIKGGIRSDEILIIASLLEKEAKTKEDMELVAGIIKKRLELGMLLQIDASVAYGWCLKETALKDFKDFKAFCDVTQAPLVLEIKIDGPYNTYTRKGLPIGPISNPGLKAIRAALNPQPSDYLFYLSTRDGSQIIYSKTSAEHTANRRKYLGL